MRPRVLVNFLLSRLAFRNTFYLEASLSACIAELAALSVTSEFTFVACAFTTITNTLPRRPIGYLVGECFLGYDSLSCRAAQRGTEPVVSDVDSLAKPGSTLLTILALFYLLLTRSRARITWKSHVDVHCRGNSSLSDAYIRRGSHAHECI